MTILKRCMVNGIHVILVQYKHARYQVYWFKDTSCIRDIPDERDIRIWDKFEHTKNATSHTGAPSLGKLAAHARYNEIVQTIPSMNFK